MENRFYWLRLKDDFFSSKRIKKLRTMKRGDTYLIIYLKLQLLAVRTQGVLEYTGLEDTLAEELALDIDENAKDVATVLEYLERTELIATEDGGHTWVLPFVVDNTGTEGSSAARMRAKRREQSAHNVQDDANNVRTMCEQRYGETETETEKEIDIEKTEALKSKSKATGGPALGDIEMYCQKEGLTVNPYAFWKTFEERGWVQDGEPVRNWKAMLKAWERAKRTVAGKPDEMIMAVLKQMEEAGA